MYKNGSKGVSEGFGDLSEETKKYGNQFNEGKGTQPMYSNAVV